MSTVFHGWVTGLLVWTKIFEPKLATKPAIQE